MPSAGVRLFVYGSLKRGGRHHDQLVGARFLGLAETQPGYRLEQLGEYLALVPVPNHGNAAGPDASTVEGELFEVDEALLPALDAFEGDAYYRAQVRVRVLLLPGPDRAQTGHEPGNGAFALAYLKRAG